MTRVHSVELRTERDRIALFVESGRGPFEPETVAAFVAAIKENPSGTVYDIGAYTGLFTILALKAGAAEVIAIEPNPAGVQRLAENVARARVDTRRLRVLQAAASAFPGQGVLEITDETKGICSTGKLIGGVNGPVKVVSLDRLAPRHRVSVIKLDVEGHELFVLSGAAATLERYRPLIIAEVDSGSGGNRTEIVSEYLSHFGYRGRPVDGRNMIFEVDNASRDDRAGAARGAGGGG